MLLIPSVMAATGMMPTQLDVVDTIPPNSFHQMPALHAVPARMASQEHQETAKTVQVLTPSVMAATGMLPTHQDVETTIPPISHHLMSAAFADQTIKIEFYP